MERGNLRRVDEERGSFPVDSSRCRLLARHGQVQPGCTGYLTNFRKLTPGANLANDSTARLTTRIMPQIPYIPITVFTGFLGAGKTSIILSLLPKLPKDYKVVLLKNEFGDIQGRTPLPASTGSPSSSRVVDSQLAKQSSLAAVSEILNGCMCVW